MLRIESFDQDEVGQPSREVELDEGLEDLDDPQALMRRREAEAIYGSDDDVSGPINDSGWESYFGQAETFTITRLTPGVRDPNRVNVFLDGRFAFSLDVSQVIDLQVKVGQRINSQRLKELQDASEFGKLYQRTLEWVLTRPHSVRETRDYLKRRKIKRKQLNRQRTRDEKRLLPEIQDEAIQLVVERLIEKHYLDDQKFANFYVENRFVRRGVSQKRLRMELKQKGVNDEQIKAAFHNVPREESEEIAKVILKKRAKYNDFKLVNYLVRQGFDYQLAKTAVEKSHENETNA